MHFISGKLVIITILTLAVSAAGASWWFRFAATHRAAQFWGPTAVRLIRDAPRVALYQLNGTENLSTVTFDESLLPTDAIDMSHTPGLTHLRNALLEDRSYHWLAQTRSPDVPGHWALAFFDGEDGATLTLSSDWKWVRMAPNGTTLSCEPIAAGLATMLESTANESAAR